MIVPILITDPISKNDIWELCHNRHGGCVHQIHSPFIVRFFKPILSCESKGGEVSTASAGKMVTIYLWNPRPSIRTTIHVFGSKMSACSKAFTYSYLKVLTCVQVSKGLFTLSSPYLLSGFWVTRVIVRLTIFKRSERAYI